jgi:hypothetical protein
VVLDAPIEESDMSLSLMLLLVVAGSSDAVSDEINESLARAWFDFVLAPQSSTPDKGRLTCVAIGDKHGHHDPAKGMIETLQKRYPWILPASACPPNKPIMAVGPWWYRGKRLLGFAGIETSMGRCTVEAIAVGSGAWRFKLPLCNLE